MTQAAGEDWKRSILSGPYTAKLATVRQDGRPHVSPIWFDLDGESVVFMTGRTTAKGVNLRRDPRVALCIDDELPPFAFVTIEGLAEVIEAPPPGEQLAWAIRIAGRYMGASRAEEFGTRNAVPGEMLVRVRPARILTQPWAADWHPRPFAP